MDKLSDAVAINVGHVDIPEDPDNPDRAGRYLKLNHLIILVMALRTEPDGMDQLLGFLTESTVF